jgi:Reverse transcriptase (RNA-dependent DNA polymerase)
VQPVFCGASLCALTKKEGGIRPIAVGCVLGWLIAKWACRLVNPKMATHLSHTELSFVVPRAIETAGHAARCYISHLRPGQTMLKLDFKNAFNSVYRDITLQTIPDDLPELNPFVYQCYANASVLQFGDELLSSSVGAQQGDPLGPLLFCLASFKLTRSVQSEFNVGYLDDGTIASDADALLRDLELVKREGPNIRLLLNERKCKIITDDFLVVARFREVAPTIVHLTPESRRRRTSRCTCWQQCICHVSFATQILGAKVFDRSFINSSSTWCIHLLRHCFSIPKLWYTLHSAPCFADGSLGQYDRVIQMTLMSLLNTNLSASEAALTQAVLPASAGGLGKQMVTNLALPAFMSSSITGTNDLVKWSRFHDFLAVDEPVYCSATDAWLALTQRDSISV